MGIKKIEKYIKNKQGDKVEAHHSSIKIELRHAEFLQELNLNLSSISRDAIEELIIATGWKPKAER